MSDSYQELLARRDKLQDEMLHVKGLREQNDTEGLAAWHRRLKREYSEIQPKLREAKDLQKAGAFAVLLDMAEFLEDWLQGEVPDQEEARELLAELDSILPTWRKQ